MTNGPTALSMRWEDVLFAHWPVDPALVQPTLPDGLEIDEFEGEAYLSVVAFVMSDISPRGVPMGLSFPELNLRTYVTHEDGPPGIYFYNLDADDRIGVPVARKLFGLPYYRAEMDVARFHDGIRFRSRRTHDGVPAAVFDATYRPTGEAYQPDPGTLEAFLTERYRFYAVGQDRLPAVDLDGDQLYAGAIAHEPWTLRDAAIDIERNGLFEAAGFEVPSGEPVCQFGPGIDVTAGRVRRL